MRNFEQYQITCNTAAYNNKLLTTSKSNNKFLFKLIKSVTQSANIVHSEARL